MREDTILRKLRGRDPAGLEALMDRYLPYVSTVVWSILRGSMSPEDGEEVASDVFLAAWEQSADLRPGQVKAWLGAVARNKAKNKLRQRGQTLPLEEDVIDLPGPGDPAGELEQTEERRLVRRAVDSLPGQDREIFLRHYYYAQSVKEISAAMDLNESTVKTKLRRGRLKLKELLTKEELA
ncbi:MAG: RNA polymerase sigma factor [Clostridiales bacterium]|nr:RNA polymerase sigma factor [Clostridiales bacterium]